MGEAPAPHVPSVPGGRLAPLTRAFRTRRQQQQRAIARTPQTITVMQSEPAEARQERARQIAQLRAFLREGARGVALQNLPAAPPPASTDPDATKVEDVKAGVRGGLHAKHDRQFYRDRVADLRRKAEARTAKKTVPLKQFITPSGMVLDEDEIGGAEKAPPAAAHANVKGAADIAADLRGEA